VDPRERNWEEGIGSGQKQADRDWEQNPHNLLFRKNRGGKKVGRNATDGGPGRQDTQDVQDKLNFLGKMRTITGGEKVGMVKKWRKSTPDL